MTSVVVIDSHRIVSRLKTERNRFFKEAAVRKCVREEIMSRLLSVDFNYRITVDNLDVIAVSTAKIVV